MACISFLQGHFETSFEHEEHDDAERCNSWYPPYQYISFKYLKKSNWPHINVTIWFYVIRMPRMALPVAESKPLTRMVPKILYPASVYLWIHLFICLKLLMSILNATSRYEILLFFFFLIICFISLSPLLSWKAYCWWLFVLMVIFSGTLLSMSKFGEGTLWFWLGGKRITFAQGLRSQTARLGRYSPICRPILWTYSALSYMYLMISPCAQSCLVVHLQNNL